MARIQITNQRIIEKKNRIKQRLKEVMGINYIHDSMVVEIVLDFYLEKNKYFKEGGK